MAQMILEISFGHLVMNLSPTFVKKEAILSDILKTLRIWKASNVEA